MTVSTTAPHDALPSNRRTGAFERRVARALDALVPAAAPLLVACSGGPDSSAALVAVARARPGVAVTAAHFDHGLRPRAEAQADRHAVEALAARLGRSTLGGAQRPRGAARTEAALRGARYHWLATACARAGAEYCVTGHTRDDQAETVLLRLVRGAGARGAAGMGPLAPWPLPERGRREAGPRLVRPLLEIGREDVQAYLAALGVAARHDPSNDDLAFARNRVRALVLPELRKLNPRAGAALARFATAERRDDEALEELAGREAERLLRRAGPVASLPRRELLALPEAVALRLLRRACAAAGVAAEAEQLQGLLRIARRRGSRRSLGGGEAMSVAERLEIRGPGEGRRGATP
ncbi:MAG: tRNA lysidine(34) synthetase TilS [Dehalococcoidia bacterium]|nr:tRNA lysidine(34) synthetase TilS [Dehalococcoidia bacterium]